MVILIANPSSKLIFQKSMLFYMFIEVELYKSLVKLPGPMLFVLVIWPLKPAPWLRSLVRQMRGPTFCQGLSKNHERHFQMRELQIIPNALFLSRENYLPVNKTKHFRSLFQLSHQPAYSKYFKS